MVVVPVQQHFISNVSLFILLLLSYSIIIFFSFRFIFSFFSLFSILLFYYLIIIPFSLLLLEYADPYGSGASSAAFYFPGEDVYSHVWSKFLVISLIIFIIIIYLFIYWMIIINIILFVYDNVFRTAHQTVKEEETQIFNGRD